MLKLLIVMLVAATMLGAASASPAAVEHRNGCHTKHTCPSDHHSYLWRGLSCAAKTSPKYNAARDKIVRTYAGRRYYCRKGK